MKFQLRSDSLGDLRYQRFLLLVFTSFLLITNLTQAVLSLSQNERIVVVPPDLKQEVWLEKNRVSASYLEEWGLYYAQLLLNNSPSNIAFQREIILRQAVEHAYGPLKRRLMEDEDRIKKENVTTSFQPNFVKVDPNKMSVEITGDLLRYVGEKRISQSRDVYSFAMVYRYGRLLIESFKLIRSDQND
jgi:conjugal transfer pilus assembly protein TraE